MSKFTINDFEEDMKADEHRRKQDELHEYHMRTDFEYFMNHSLNVQTLIEAAEELDGEYGWEILAILENIIKDFK